MQLNALLSYVSMKEESTKFTYTLTHNSLFLPQFDVICALLEYRLVRKWNSFVKSNTPEQKESVA